MRTDPTYGFSTNLSTRKRGVFFLDVVRSNPNGDPDRGGDPRVLLDGRGIIMNACLKRVPRDYVAGVEGKDLYMARGADLNEVQAKYGNDAQRMTESLWDIRPFGGTLTAADARVRGAVQFNDAVSIDPVTVLKVGGTRVSGHTRERNRTNDAGESETEDFLGANMFSYKVVEYGLYRGEFTFDPFQAKRVGLTEEDLCLLYAGLIEGFEYTRSAHRTGVNLRALYVFDSPTARGTEPSHVTANRVKVALRDGVAEASRFEDYQISVDDRLPTGMTLAKWEDGVLTAIAA